MRSTWQLWRGSCKAPKIVDSFMEIRTVLGRTGGTAVDCFYLGDKPVNRNRMRSLVSRSSAMPQRQAAWVLLCTGPGLRKLDSMDMKDQ